MTKRLLLALLLVSSACDSDDDTPTGGSTTTGSSEASSEGSSSTADTAESQVEELCNCLLIDCHEAYHAQYGPSDLEAAQACNAEGDALPADEGGDSVACRLAACESGECEAALGAAAPCI